MILIPAIDLMDNQCVRLRQGDFDTRVIYSHDPVQRAKQFQTTGFTHLHLVDLDGARQQKPAHLSILEQIAKETRLHIDYSGGIRHPRQIQQAFDMGASAVTIGSLAVYEPQTTQNILQRFGAEKIILGADVRDECISTQGWVAKSDQCIYSFLDTWTKKGFRKIMITDISKDGMLQGAAFALYEKVLEKFPHIRLIASGGIATMEDICQLEKLGCYAAITGKALYEEKLEPQALVRYLQKSKKAQP